MAANEETANEPLSVEGRADGSTNRDQADDENEPYPLDDLEPLDYFLCDEKIESGGNLVLDGLTTPLRENEGRHSPMRQVAGDHNNVHHTSDYGTNVARAAVPLAENHPLEPHVDAQNTAVTRKKPRRRSSSKKKVSEPEVNEYIDEPTNKDVLMGRGGKSNHHPGNKRYRKEVKRLQTQYFSATKNEKTSISNALVQRVHGYGGRFLKKKKSIGKWYIVPDATARRKASQALREKQVVNDDDDALMSEESAESDN